VTVLFRICRQLVGRRLTPDSISFVHRRRSLPADLQLFFGCQVRFSSKLDEIVYARSVLELPVVSADPFLNKLLERFCEEAIAGRRVRSSDWRTRVENAVVQLLPHGRIHLADVCSQLGVNSRTLSRRLASETLTFAKVVDDLRQDLAKRYLREPDLPVSEIAWLLGYQQTSSFNHAFKRWTGTKPSRARASGSMSQFGQ